MEMIKTEQYREATAYLVSQIEGNPETAIILSSGLGSLAGQVTGPIVIPYTEIPHFMESTTTGHRGNSIYDKLGDKQVLAMQGRLHCYKGYTMQQMIFSIRVVKLLRIKSLLVSDVAEGISNTFRVSDLMIIQDHTNMMPNPLVGPDNEDFGTRFPDMTRAYDRGFIRYVEKMAAPRSIPLKKGVYVGLTGPSFETLSGYALYEEVRGGATGMSTIPEVIVVRYAGLCVSDISAITNRDYHFADDFVNDSADTVVAADKAASVTTQLLGGLVKKI